MKKIPEITLFFWILKICATTLGETGGDLLSKTLQIGYALSSLLLLSLFAVAVISQIASKKLHSWLFWGVILLTSTAGTTMSDYMDRTLGLGYAKGSFILVTLLLAILAIWKFSGYPLAVDKIRTRKVEVFYWTTILFSNTLGTALGDFLADDSGLGFAGGTLLIGGILCLLLAAYYFTNISRVFLFWVAFVLTRPFGANMGDFLVRSHAEGGLNFGTIGSSAVLGAIMISFLVYTSLVPESVKER